MSEEYFRAVKDDSEVLGMFLTAEQANPNIFHVMNIFKDESAYKNYIGSKFYKNLRQKINSMIISENEIEYLPANIILTQKGSRK